MYFYRGINTENRNTLITRLLDVRNAHRGWAELAKQGPTFVRESLDTAILYAKNKPDENNAQIVLRVDINEDNFSSWQPYLYYVKMRNETRDYFIPLVTVSYGRKVVYNVDVLPVDSLEHLYGEIQIKLSDVPDDVLNTIEVAELGESEELRFIRFETFRYDPPEFKLA
jgi:hypothetical protein